MGGTQSTFRTTQWSEIRAFAQLNQKQQKAVLTGLAVKYWKPVYCYLRRNGYDNEQAKDLTQGFFDEVVLGRQLIERADAARGRFRTFLLTALDRYVVSIHRHQAAAKRRPREGVISLEGVQEATLSIAAKDMRPDEAFTHAWAVEFLQEVLVDLQARYVQDGRETRDHLGFISPLKMISCASSARSVLLV